MVPKAIPSFLGAAAISTLILYPGDSFANWKRTFCVQFPSTGESLPSLGTNCAWPDESDSFEAYNTTSFYANFYFAQTVCNANDVQAKVCIAYWNSTGGGCGTTAGNAGSQSCNGGQGVSVDASLWSTAGNYAHTHYVTYTITASYWYFKGFYAGYP